MNLFRSTAVALALTTGLLTMPAQAQSVQQNASGDPMYTVEAPKAFSIVGDLLIARPLLIAATVVGAGLFVVSLPFTAMGGGIGNWQSAGSRAGCRCFRSLPGLHSRWL